MVSAELSTSQTSSRSAWLLYLNEEKWSYLMASALVLQCMSHWDRVKAEERWTKDWGLKALAATQRLTLSLAAFADRIYSLVQPHADSFQVGSTLMVNIVGIALFEPCIFENALLQAEVPCSLLESQLYACGTKFTAYVREFFIILVSATSSI